MRIETILNAYDKAGFHCDHLSGQTTHDESDELTTLFYRRVRQCSTLRDRIIRMDERNKMEIARLTDVVECMDGELELWHRGIMGISE